MITKELIKQFFITESRDKMNIPDAQTLRMINRPNFFRDVVGCDSLDVVDFFILLRKKMKINVSDRDIEVIRSYSLQQIVDFIYEKHIVGNPNPVVTQTRSVGGAYSDMRVEQLGAPYCKLLGAPCGQPVRNNTTNRPYCEFIECRLYKNFQKLR